MSGLKEILDKIKECGDYDLHDILSKQKKVKWCDWHLNIDENKNAITIAEKFHEEIKKRLKSPSNITRDINIIKATFLELLPPDRTDWNQIKDNLEQTRTNNDWNQLKNDLEQALTENDWNQIENNLEQARINNDWNRIKDKLEEVRTNSDWNQIKNYLEQALTNNGPKMVIKAYTVSQNLSKRLHLHSAVNTYHSLKLYCTLLNCPILAQTQEYTEAFTRILFRPELKQYYLVQPMKVYRGATLDEKRFVDNYKEGATIITTTFLSTSANPDVAEIYCDRSGKMDDISLFCTYNINDTSRPIALNLTDLSHYLGGEEEILILRYVPFKIQSIKRVNNGQRIEIWFDQCGEQLTVQETRV